MRHEEAGGLPKTGKNPAIDPPPCAPTNARPGFPFGFLGACGRLPKARRGRVSIVQFIIITASVFFISRKAALAPRINSMRDARDVNGRTTQGNSAVFSLLKKLF